MILRETVMHIRFSQLSMSSTYNEVRQKSIIKSQKTGWQFVKQQVTRSSMRYCLCFAVLLSRTSKAFTA